MKLKRVVLLLFFLLAGMVLGALLASACAEVSSLSWLAFERTIGFNPESPLVLDLSVVRFSFGFSVSISVAQIFTIGLSILAFNLITRQRK